MLSSSLDFEPRHQSISAVTALVDKRMTPYTSPTTMTDTPFKISQLTSEQISKLLLTASSNTAIEFPEYPSAGRSVFELGKLDAADGQPNQFQFQAFDIRTRQPNEDEFMGSFLHVQEERSSPFDVNIKIPSLQEYSAFSNILAMSSSKKASQLSQEKATEFNRSKLLSELHESKAKTQQRKRLLEHQDSIFDNLEPLLNYQLPERMLVPMWEDDLGSLPSECNDPNASKLIYSQLVEQMTQQYEKSNSFFFEAQPVAISEKVLIDHLCKVLQGIETPTFQLDYQLMKWSVGQGVNFRVGHYFKDSLPGHVDSILRTAGYRSEIQVALNFLKRSEAGKKFIYSQIRNVYVQCMLMFQAIINECQLHDITFMEFELEVRRVGAQLKLLKRFLLKDPSPSTYDNFNEGFINSEKDLFYMAYNRLKLNDSSQEQQKKLVERLTFGGFRCILYSLNVRLHHSRKEWEQHFYQDYYFTLFFERRRELIDKLSQRMNILHNEDYEVYSVCREKKPIELKTNYAELQQYEADWNRLTERKKNAIQSIEQRIVVSRQRKHDDIYQRKAKQIIEMKLKLAQRLQNDSRLRVEQKQKQREYIQRLQNQIKRKQEEQRLNKLIEIQREKGFLLDSQLNEKRKLISEKYELFASHPEMIGVFKTSNQLPGFQLKKAHSETEHLTEGVVIEPNSLRRIASHDRMEEEEQGVQPDSTAPQGLGMDHPQQPQSHQVTAISNLPSEIFTNEPSEPIVEQPIRVQGEPLKMQEELPKPTIQSEVPLGTAIEVCVNQVIQNQLSVVNLAMASLLYTKHNIRSIFEFMRNYFLSSKGHFIGDLLDDSVCAASYLRLSSLKDSFFADVDEDILQLKPSFYRVSQDLNQKSTDLFGQVNLIHQNLEMRVGFDFKALPEMLKPYFNYIHLVKYMEIFSFVLKLRHCVRLTELEWKALSNYERTLVRSRESKNSEQWEMLRKLHHIRYIIQACLNRLQNYLYFYVIEQAYGWLDNYLKARQFQQLPEKHLNFLDRIIVRGFINNPQRKISARLRQLFSDVREFHNYVTLFCLDDIPVYSRSQTNDKINQVKQKCKQFSNILEYIMGDR